MEEPAALKVLDFRVNSGTTHLLCGPSNSGKTVRVANILRNKNSYIKNGENIKNIVFCYAAWQKIYSDLDNEGIVTKWVNMLPNNEQFKELVSGHKDIGGSVVVFDDFLSEVNKDMVEIVCVTSRHYNTTTFLLFQNLFPGNPLARQISLNVKYIYVHKNPRENTQMSFLARQINPNNYKWIVAAYQEATKKPYGCLVIDMTQETPNELRFRSNVLPNEFPMIIWMNSNDTI